MASPQQTQELEQENKSPDLENTVGVAKLREIQELVYQAQEKIKYEDYEAVKTDLWPVIKRKLGKYTVLAWKFRKKLGLLIHKRLEEQRSERAEPELINLEKLIKQIQEGEVEVPEERPSPLKWLPY